jgi:hypothetical protein
VNLIRELPIARLPATYFYCLLRLWRQKKKLLYYVFSLKP